MVIKNPVLKNTFKRLVKTSRWKDQLGILELTISLCTDKLGKTSVLFTNNRLKAQLCKLCYNKYMIASKQITNTEIFAFIALLQARTKYLRKTLVFL